MNAERRDFCEMSKEEKEWIGKKYGYRKREDLVFFIGSDIISPCVAYATVSSEAISSRKILERTWSSYEKNELLYSEV